MKTHTFQTLTQLMEHIRSHRPSIYRSAGTSRVVPFENFEHHPATVELRSQNIDLVDLAQLPKKIEILEGDKLHICGPVSWEEAESYAYDHGRDLISYPTEKTASILAGIATSCTGERNFGSGTLRDQIYLIKWIGYDGQIYNSDSKSFDLKAFQDPKSQALLQQYQKEYSNYQSFKNAPYPRLEKEIDLMIGTEGQLGVITQCILKTRSYTPTVFLAIELTRWTHSTENHLKFLQSIQKFRGPVLSCEFIDRACLAYVDSAIKGQFGSRDLIILEIEEDYLEEFLQALPREMNNNIPLEHYYQIPAKKFHQMRAEIPRKISELTIECGTQKMSSDVQVKIEQLGELLNYYLEGTKTKVAVPYVLFGHFGDAHLHFNLLPRTAEEENLYARPFFEELYLKVKEWNGSPFAEHGIGLIKQKYMKQFYGSTQKEMFKILKNHFDPYQQFFPRGYMNI